jgi:hypothetical protein
MTPAGRDSLRSGVPGSPLAVSCSRRASSTRRKSAKWGRQADHDRICDVRELSDVCCRKRRGCKTKALKRAQAAGCAVFGNTCPRQQVKRSSDAALAGPVDILFTRQRFNAGFRGGPRVIATVLQVANSSINLARWREERRRRQEARQGHPPETTVQYWRWSVDADGRLYPHDFDAAGLTGIPAVDTIFEVMHLDCHPDDFGYSAFRVESVMRTLVRRGSGVARPDEVLVFLEPVKHPNQSQSHSIDVDEYEAARSGERSQGPGAV